MATVPTYDNFQANPNGLPGARIEGAVPVNTIGQQTENMARGLAVAGNALGAVADREQDQLDRIRVTEALGKATETRLELTLGKDTGFAHLRGKAALERPDKKSLDDEYGETFDKSLTEIEGGLGNERQKRLFRERAAPMSVDFRGKVMEHTARESMDYQLSVHDGSIKLAVAQMGLEWGSPDKVLEAKKTIETSIVEMGRLKGWSGPETESMMRAALSPGHSAVISGAVDAGKSEYAREYMKQHTSELTNEARLQLTKLVERGDFEERTQTAADQLWNETGNDAAAALKLAREKYSGKEEDAIVTRIKTYDAEKTVIRERDQREAADIGWGLFAEGQRIPPSVWARMDGRDKIAVRNAQRIAADRATVGNVAARDERYFTMYEDDNALAEMSPAQITAMRSTGFTAQQVSSLLRKKEKLVDEVEEVKVGRNALNAAFLKAGIENKKAGDKALRGQITAAIDEEIYAEQQSRKRALTRDEKQAIINRQFVEVQSYYTQSNLFNAKTGTRPMKYYEVGMKESIVIPDAKRDEITSILLANKITVTPERIRDFYMRGLGQ